MAAMMSSSDSMLLSGASYLTRDIYRPLTGASATGEAGAARHLSPRVGVVVFATLSFVASLYAPGTLVQIGDTAFGGFAQLARAPSRRALLVPGTTLGNIRRSRHLPAVLPRERLPLVRPGSYLGGWSASVVGMLLGLLLTVGVSLATSPRPARTRRSTPSPASSATEGNTAPPRTTFDPPLRSFRWSNSRAVTEATFIRRSTADSSMCEGEKSGGDPQTLGQCRECGSVYPVQTTSSGERCAPSELAAAASAGTTRSSPSRSDGRHGDGRWGRGYGRKFGPRNW